MSSSRSVVDWKPVGDEALWVESGLTPRHEKGCDVMLWQNNFFRCALEMKQAAIAIVSKVNKDI